MVFGNAGISDDLTVCGSIIGNNLSICQTGFINNLIVQGTVTGAGFSGFIGGGGATGATGATGPAGGPVRAPEQLAQQEMGTWNYRSNWTKW